MGYEHTQRSPIRSPLRLWPYLLASLVIVAIFPDHPLPLVAAFALFFVFCMSCCLFPFEYLVVSEDSSHLCLRFGPFPHVVSFAFRDITSAEPASSRFTLGQVGASLFGGRLYRVWGRDFVVLRVKGEKIRIGTDDGENLLAVIRRRMEQIERPAWATGEAIGYKHTQWAPVVRVLAPFILIGIVGGLGFADKPYVQFVGLTVALGLSLHVGFSSSLTVEDSGDHLKLRYGPLPSFRKRIPYSQITSVEAGRSAVIDGWGIHVVAWRGWTYNLWGFDCAILNVNGRTVRIGSDDVPNLVEFLRRRIEQSKSAA